MTQIYGIPLTASAACAVQALVHQGTTEPIGHQLLREAMDVSGQNPRSAIVIGVAAAETGFKRLVADLVPDAAWLIKSVPSPPLVQMLKDYLPTLVEFSTGDCWSPAARTTAW